MGQEEGIKELWSSVRCDLSLERVLNVWQTETKKEEGRKSSEAELDEEGRENDTVDDDYQERGMGMTKGADAVELDDAVQGENMRFDLEKKKEMGSSRAREVMVVNLMR